MSPPTKPVRFNPEVGWHLLSDVHKPEVQKSLYPIILGKSQFDWNTALDRHGNDASRALEEIDEQNLVRLFYDVIRFHDLFGVLSTGEASLPVMVDLVGFLGIQPTYAKRLFSALMIFNLADVYGSVPKVRREKVHAFCGDWRVLCECIGAADGVREKFFESLREKASENRYAVNRLWRLMNEEVSDDLRDRLSEDTVFGILTEVSPTGIRKFCDHLALFCKLDYCLRFKKKLASKRGGLPPEQHMRMWINRMIMLLVEIDRRYGGICTDPDRRWRRLGIQMSGLTRVAPLAAIGEPGGAGRAANGVGETIRDLLLSQEPLGKKWALDEVYVWYMDE
jgi:hypothetical protein